MLWLSQLINCVCQNGFILLLNLFCQNSVMIAVDQERYLLLSKKKTGDVGMFLARELWLWLLVSNMQFLIKTRLIIIGSYSLYPHFTISLAINIICTESQKKSSAPRASRRWPLARHTRGGANMGAPGVEPTWGWGVLKPPYPRNFIGGKEEGGEGKSGKKKEKEGGRGRSPPSCWGGSATVAHITLFCFKIWGALRQCI